MPGHGSHVIFGGILVIITLYWPVSVVFVAEKEWKGALVVIVFTSAVQKPQSAAGLRGWQWLAVLEVSAMVEGWIINFCSNSYVVLHCFFWINRRVIATRFAAAYLRDYTLLLYFPRRGCGDTSKTIPLLSPTLL